MKSSSRASNTLAQAAELASLALDNRCSSDTRSACFCLDGSAIQVNSGAIAISTRWGGSCPSKVLVNGTVFASLAKRLPAKIELKIKSGKLVIKSGSSTSELIQSGNAQTFKFPVLRGLQWSPLPTDFADAIKWCNYVVATDSLMGCYCGICLTENEVWGSDGLRISRYRFTSQLVGINKVVLSPKFVKLLLKYSMELADFALLTNSSFAVRLKNKTVIVGMPSNGDKYRDLSEHMPATAKNMKHITFDTDISTILKRHLSFQSMLRKAYSSIRLSVKNDACRISSKTSNGRMNESLTLASDNCGEFEFLMNPHYLAILLKYARDFYYDPKTGKIYFESQHKTFVTYAQTEGERFKQKRVNSVQTSTR